MQICLMSASSKELLNGVTTIDETINANLNIIYHQCCHGWHYHNNNDYLRLF